MPVVIDALKGIQMPNITTANKDAIVSPLTGAVVFDTTLNALSIYSGSAWQGAGAALNSWPVGSVFISVVATNPNTLLGGGTWISFGAGRVMVGLDATQTEFDVVEEVGGAKTHTLTIAEIPSHSHTYPTNTGAVLGQTVSTGYPGSPVSTSSATGGGGAHNNLQPYIVCYFWKRTA